MTMAYVLVILWLTLFSAGLWLRVRRERANVLRLKALLNANYGKWGPPKVEELQFPDAILNVSESRGDEPGSLHSFIDSSGRVAFRGTMTAEGRRQWDAFAEKHKNDVFYCDTDSCCKASGPDPEPLKLEGEQVVGGTFTTPKFIRQDGQVTFLREDEEVVRLADGGIRVVTRSK